MGDWEQSVLFWEKEDVHKHSTHAQARSFLTLWEGSWTDVSNFLYTPRDFGEPLWKSRLDLRRCLQATLYLQPLTFISK
jgi:hypothetical protein